MKNKCTIIIFTGVCLEVYRGGKFKPSSLHTNGTKNIIDCGQSISSRVISMSNSIIAQNLSFDTEQKAKSKEKKNRALINYGSICIMHFYKHLECNKAQQYCAT